MSHRVCYNMTFFRRCTSPVQRLFLYSIVLACYAVCIPLCNSVCLVCQKAKMQRRRSCGTRVRQPFAPDRLRTKAGLPSQLSHLPAVDTFVFIFVRSLQLGKELKIKSKQKYIHCILCIDFERTDASQKQCLVEPFHIQYLHATFFEQIRLANIFHHSEQ